MADASKEELIVRKAVREAESGLKGLEKDLRAAVKQFQNGALTEAKAKAAAGKIVSYMKKQAQVTKLQNAPFFGTLPVEVQDDVVWLDGVVNSLNNALGRLSDALRLMKKSPDKDMKLLVKATKEYEPLIRQPPKGLGTLIKEVKKGLDPDHPMGPSVSLLPLVILMWLIIDTIIRGLKER